MVRVLLLSLILIIVSLGCANSQNSSEMKVEEEQTKKTQISYVDFSPYFPLSGLEKQKITLPDSISYKQTYGSVDFFVIADSSGNILKAMVANLSLKNIEDDIEILSFEKDIILKSAEEEYVYPNDIKDLCNWLSRHVSNLALKRNENPPTEELYYFILPVDIELK